MTRYFKGTATDPAGAERQCCYGAPHTSWQAAEDCMRVTALQSYETVGHVEIKLRGRKKA